MKHRVDELGFLFSHLPAILSTFLNSIYKEGHSVLITDFLWPSVKTLRPEHAEAVSWLNELSSGAVSSYLIKLEVFIKRLTRQDLKEYWSKHALTALNVKQKAYHQHSRIKAKN